MNIGFVNFAPFRQPYRGIMNLSLAGDTHITSSDLSTHMAAVALGDLTELFNFQLTNFIYDLFHISLTLISFTGTYEPTIDLLRTSVAS